MTKRNKNRFIPKSASQTDVPRKYLSNSVANIRSQIDSGNNAQVFVSLKYIQHDFQCFSEWDKTELNTYWDFNRRIHEMSWSEVYKTASKGAGKTGLAYTVIPLEKYPKNGFRESFSPETTIFELRLSDRIRVHGFRSDFIFYLCWLDKNHEITG